MNLAEIRAKYPQYKDVDDTRLAEALYQKYYTHADRREFDAKVGLKPYDNAAQTMGKALIGAPGNIQIGISGVAQQLAEGEGGAPNQLIDQLKPGFKLSERPGIDEVNLIQWGRQKLGLDTTTPLTADQRAQIEALASAPEGKAAFTEYIRTGAAPLGTDPTKVAMADLKGQLERQQIQKSIPELDAAPGSVEAIAGGAVGSIAQMAPGYAASIVTRNPLPAVTLAQVLTQGQSYADARDKGLEPGKAAEYAISSGFAEAVGEALPLGMILKEGGKLLPKLFKAGVAEGVQEGVTQLIQSMLASGTVTPDMTWGDVKDQVITAVATGAVTGVALTGAVSGVDSLRGKKPTAELVSEEVLGTPPVDPDTPIEERVALPGPQTLLALSSPEAFAPPPATRRQGPAPAVAEKVIDDADYAARVALGRTKQAETAELLQTARETITPLGTFDVSEIGDDAAGKVRQHRIRMGRPVEAPVTIEDLARAKVPQRRIDAIIAQRRPMTSEGIIRPVDVRNAANDKNLVYDDGNFAELAFRTTGQRNLDRMSQSQLNALKTTIDAMPVNAERSTIPVADDSPFTEDQYGKALDAVRNQGRYTAKAIKDATGLNDDKAVRAVRDAMVRRGQLVERGKGDYRLYDVLGEERQSTPDDLPPGAFKEHVVRRIPVGKVRVRVDGKSVGTYGSGTEARGEVSRLRDAKGPKAKIEIEPAEEVAWGVMENRYDQEGNLLGQVVVDTHRDETAAAKAATELNAPADTGARYTATPVPGAAPVAQPAPKRVIEPAALAGRVPEILKRLNQQAKDRKLPLLGVRVQVKPRIKTMEGDDVEGLYWRKLMQLTAQNLDASMSTDEIVERLGQVMDHETIHALREAGVLGPETAGWKSIMRYARRAKRPGTNETYFEWARRSYTGIPGYTDPSAIEEEAIAEAFRHWASNKRSVVGQPATVFRQLVEWFRRLISAMPEDVFRAIETGAMVEEALTPPGSSQPRARATKAMQEAAAGVTEAIEAKNENAARVRSREYLRARAQAREDRFGRSGPKTVLGTNAGRGYNEADVDTAFPRTVAEKYRKDNGVSTSALHTLLPEDTTYLMRVADAQQRGSNSPGADDVAKAYRALIDETKAMWRALGDVVVEAWTGDGAPYASAAEMLADVAGGRLRMRLSDDLFGPGADNPGHPLNAASGVKTVDGRDLSNNDLFRIVHDVYGHGQSGFRDDPRGQYNAYHEHARLVSPEARKALATETLAQSAWANYGPHLRRRDGTVPRPTDVDYLRPSLKEFAEQKAFLLDDELITADPGWALADAASAATEMDPRFMVGWHGTPHKVDKFSSSKIGTGEGAQAFGYGLYFAGKKEVAEHYQNMLSQDTVGPAERALKKEQGNIEAAIATAQREIDRLRALDLTPATGADVRDRRIASQESIIREIEAFAATGVWKKGNLYKVDIPEDNELLDWDAPLSEQPPKVRAILERLGWTKDALGAEDPTGQQIYQRSKPFLGDEALASKTLREAGIPGHRFLDANSRVTGDGTRNYVIYDDDRIQILEENPKFSRFDDNLPGGRLYGNPNRSPGGALSKPGAPSPAFTWERPGNQFFGGEMADEQLRMVREGDRGATMIYMPPEDYLALAGSEVNPEQEVYDAAIAAGYKLADIPSLVTEGYAGNVRVSGSDGAAGVRAMAGRSDAIPVVLYPRTGESLGHVTALEGPDGARVPWPHEGRAENFPDERPDGEPKFSLNAPYGQRVPNTPPGPMHNIVQQRTEGFVGNFLKNIGRSKKQILGTSVFDLRVKLQDKMLPVKEAIEQIKENGGNITDFNDSYMLEQLYHGKVFEEIKEREDRLQVPLLNALKDAYDSPARITPTNFEDYLYARHAPERNAFLRTRGAPSPNPSGMSDAEAGATLDKFALTGKLPTLERLAALADNIAKDTTRTRVEGGLISPEAAAASPYQYYVPLRGLAEEELDPGEDTPQTRARSGKGFSVGGREDRAVTGRSKKAGDLLGHLFLQNTEAVIRSQKNEVALSFMRLMQDNPDAGIGQILKTAPTRRVVGANGMIMEAGDPTYRQQPDIVTAKWKGKEIIARVADPAVARAIKSDYVTTNGWFVNALGRLNRWLAMVNTSLNPEFLISNLARDLQTAGILSTQYDIPGFSRRVIGDSGKAMLGIREVLRNGTANGPWAQAFRELQEAGGTTEFLGIHDLESKVRQIRRSVERTGLAPTARQALEYGAKILDFINDYNKIAENAFRLSAYVNARAAGVSVPKAAYLAKNLTINFNKGGENKALANSLYLFYNASTQGTFVLLNGLKNKRVQRIVGGVVVAGLLQDIVNRMLSGDDDDNGITDYDDIPDYVLNTNFVLMDPFGIVPRTKTGGQGYFAFPMPYGFNAFWNLGRNMSASVSGSPVQSPGKAATDSLMGFVDAFNPMGGAQNIWNFISPTFLDPLVDVITNKDFAGNDIVPERPSFGLPVPDSQKYWSNTNEVPKYIAEQLNSLTGGNEVRKGAVDWSPEVLQYVFDYATGAAGKFATRAARFGAETVPSLLQGDFENIEVGDIPFARRVVGSVNSRANTERYYAVAEEVETVAAELKMFSESGRTEEARRVFQANPAEVQMIGAFEKANKALSAMRKQIRDLRETEAIPAPRKKEMIDQIKAEQDRLMAMLNKAYFERKRVLALN